MLNVETLLQRGQLIGGSLSGAGTVLLVIHEKKVATVNCTGGSPA